MNSQTRKSMEGKDGKLNNNGEPDPYIIIVLTQLQEGDGLKDGTQRKETEERREGAKMLQKEDEDTLIDNFTQRQWSAS